MSKCILVCIKWPHKFYKSKATFVSPTTVCGKTLAISPTKNKKLIGDDDHGLFRASLKIHPHKPRMPTSDLFKKKKNVSGTRKIVDKCYFKIFNWGFKSNLKIHDTLWKYSSIKPFVSLDPSLWGKTTNLKVSCSHKSISHGAALDTG